MGLAGPLHPTLDLVAAATRRDPWTVYSDLGTQVQWNDSLGGWVVTRHATCLDVLKDPRMRADRLSAFLRSRPARDQGRLQPLAERLRHWMLLLDAPDHPRVRGAMNRAFTPQATEALRPRITALVDELLAAQEGRDGFDVIADFAYPLPATIIAELMGVPAEDRDEFKAWSDDIAAFVGTFNTDPATVEKAQASLLGMESYFTDLLAQKRERPAKDLLSDLVRIADEGARLSGPELFANGGFLLFAGHETTTNLLGNGLLALLNSPTEMHRLRGHPQLLPTAIEEFLRYDPPVDRISRIAADAMQIDGQRIEKGDRVIALTAAANRDPQEFRDPDRLDVARTPNRHLAFGQGPHFCIGAPLARLEGQIAFRRLLDTFPSMALAKQTLRWRPTIGFRGLEALRVTT
jgi:cytochrome P450